MTTVLAVQPVNFRVVKRKWRLVILFDGDAALAEVKAIVSLVLWLPDSAIQLPLKHVLQNLSRSVAAMTNQHQAWDRRLAAVLEAMVIDHH